MRPVQIITDSCSDLTPERMETYGIRYAQMNTVHDGVTKPADLAWTREEAHAFYDLIRNGNRITTTQVPVDEFQRVFTQTLEEGKDIVYIGCSSKQSGSVNTASVLARKLKEDYPDGDIRVVDSLHASTGEGLLAIEAAKEAAKGQSAAAVAAFAEEKRKYLNQFVTVHSLDALRRAGRVKATSAFFGNLMGVKPILIADADGEQTAIKKAKGRAGSFREVVALLKDAMICPEEQTVYFSHSDCSDEEVKQLTELIKSEIPCRDVYVGLIGPIIGASIGPDAVALFGFGKEITYRVSEH